MIRRPVHKKSSAKTFARHTNRTKALNLRINPMRGGWRL